MSFSTTNLFGNVRSTLPGVVNTQSIPLSRAQHFSPANIGNVSVQLTAYQLMDGALTGAPANPSTATPQYTMPTARNLLAAYSGSKQRVAVGDVFRISVFNTGGTGMEFGGGISTGVTGSFVAGTGASATQYAGAESVMHINWLAVSSDGTTGVYQLF